MTYVSHTLFLFYNSQWQSNLVWLLLAKPASWRQQRPSEVTALGTRSHICSTQVRDRIWGQKPKLWNSLSRVSRSHSSGGLNFGTWKPCKWHPGEGQTPKRRASGAWGLKTHLQWFQGMSYNEWKGRIYIWWVKWIGNTFFFLFRALEVVDVIYDFSHP